MVVQETASSTGKGASKATTIADSVLAGGAAALAPMLLGAALAGMLATPLAHVQIAGASNADFRPAVVVDYALRDDQLKPVTWNSVVSNGGSPSYFTYDDLLKEHKAAYAGLREKLLATVERVMSNDSPKQE